MDWRLALQTSCFLVVLSTTAAAEDGRLFRLHEGITAYVNNPEGRDFTVSLDVRDINLYANGPREVLFKVYAPDGAPVVREVIPDDGCASANMTDRIGGWDHELQAFVNIRAKGITPWIRWSAWSDPTRLATIVKRTFERSVKGGQKGVYRIVLAGTPDHYVTLRLSPDLSYGVAGHPTWIQGHGDSLKKTFAYVPKGTSGLFFAIAEPDYPQSRRFKLSAPDGTVLFDGLAPGGYFSPNRDEWAQRTSGFADGQYDGKLLTLEVSDGPNDFLLKMNFQQPKKGAFADYVGMGSAAVLCADKATAKIIAGGTQVVDGLVFWHPFQVRFHHWLKDNPLDGSDQEKALRQNLESVFNGFRLLETSDGRGGSTWLNWAYAMGYYGGNIFRPSWVLMRRDDVPAAAKAIIREGLIMAGDRLSFATAIEKVNGNAFTQINVALWYSQRATGDPMQKELFETFWQRWTTEGWGPGSGLSRSGDSQEHFAHDMHYGSYIMDNWRPTGNTWVKGGGILGDAADDPRFQRVMDRYYELYSYLFCTEAGPKGRPVGANPWSARTKSAPSNRTIPRWRTDTRPWKGEPGPDLTTDVNGGHEWFAARRPGYYMLTFHGRLAPAWMSECFQGQLGFGGGIICQLTIPGKGPVLASTLNDAYGKEMHPSNWRNFSLHALVGERWDGFPVVSGISEHDNARLEGNVVRSSGEIRGAHVKVSRSYTFNPDSIDCSVQLADSDFASVIHLWKHRKYWSEMRLAAEMIPFMPRSPNNKTSTKVTTAAGEVLTTEPVTTQKVRIDRGGFGVEIQMDYPMPVKLGANSTILILLVEPAPKPMPTRRIGLEYRLVPFGAAAATDKNGAKAPK